MVGSKKEVYTVRLKFYLGCEGKEWEEVGRV